MPKEDSIIKFILTNYKNIATVGFSRDPSKAAHQIPKFFIEKGYNVIPINPYANEILGRKCFKNILEVPVKIDIVQIFRPSEEVPFIVDEVIERFRERRDVKVIWMQEGIRNDRAADKARKEGLIVIQDKCMYKEYIKLFYF